MTEALFNETDLPTLRKAPSHLVGAQLKPKFATLEEQARFYECFETDPWAAAAILTVEILTAEVLDPCCGTGILVRAAIRAGYDVAANDVCDWGFPRDTEADFLTHYIDLTGKTVFMNPPFSKAGAFVDRAFELNARKVVCFQRYAWFESDDRRKWWERNPPARIWLCGDRAACWRFDIAPQDRNGNPNTAHAWFVWERGHKGGPVIGKIWRDMAV
ncbi:hypothetical protein [Hwanghaeella sp.]|uniref:hypothetical protein n=1 Tax=Hwanghaeella sp. TaxID=2605943 RepID=UPI003CCB81B3